MHAGLEDLLPEPSREGGRGGLRASSVLQGPSFPLGFCSGHTVQARPPSVGLHLPG